MQIAIQVECLDGWNAPKKWPADRFCVVVAADDLNNNRLGYDAMILSAIRSSVCSIYFWGPNASVAEDIAVFSDAENEIMNESVPRKMEGFMTVSFSEENAADAVALICGSFLPKAVENVSKATLVICGLNGAPAMTELCEAANRVFTRYDAGFQDHRGPIT